MSILSGIPAIILAGGKGSRLRSVVSDRPKVLADVDGRPYLAYLLDRFKALGVPEVILSTGYMADMVEDVIGHDHDGMPIKYAREDSPLGTGGGAVLAAAATSGDKVLVLNGDSWCEADLEKFVASVPKDCDVGMMLTRVPDVSRYGAVTLDDDGMVTSFREKGSDVGAGVINAGVYLISRSRLLSYPKEKTISMEQDIFPELVEKNLVYGHSVDAHFIDIGTPESYARVLSFFKEHLSS